MPQPAKTPTRPSKPLGEGTGARNRKRGDAMTMNRREILKYSTAGALLAGLGLPTAAAAVEVSAARSFVETAVPRCCSWKRYN